MNDADIDERIAAALEQCAAALGHFARFLDYAVERGLFPDIVEDVVVVVHDGGVTGPV